MSCAGPPLRPSRMEHAVDQVFFRPMIPMRSKVLLMLTLALLATVAWFAWVRVAPALEAGWLGHGMAARVFLPIFIAAGLLVWLWRR